MSEVRLVIREADRDWSGTIHGSVADRAVAALSADPVTLEELEVAVQRFEKPRPNSRPLRNLAPGLDAEPYDAGLVVIDLVARLVVVESTYSLPGPKGTVSYHNGHCAKTTYLRYHLADDWLFSSDGTQWRNLAETRRRERTATPTRDVRLVFYGRPLLEFLVRGTFAAFARRDAIVAAVRAEWIDKARQRAAAKANRTPDQVDVDSLTEEDILPKTWPGQEIYASPFYDTLQQIHADWLLTPREDLGGACPREVALERRDHIGWDLEDRCQQWSQLLECPQGLGKSSHAYRYAGFGTHELVKYYDLVRHLLWSCWDRLTEMAQAPKATDRPEALTVGDFLTQEVPRLEAVRQSWLDEPDPECHGRTPRSVIERERARLPEAISGHEAMVDPDCPCCQMMAEMPGPTFWCLDGSGMDDEFAFDIYHTTREEWDNEQREMEEHHKRCNEERAERKRLGVTDPTGREDGSSAIWSRSLSVEGSADVPLGIRVFGIGCSLAELIVSLRAGKEWEATPPATQVQIDQLNRHFGNLREILQSSDRSLTEALLVPVSEAFVETLAELALACPDLNPQCEALTKGLWKLFDPPSSGTTGNFGDDEIPF